MEIPRGTTLALSLLFLSFSLSLSAFLPVDNHLIACGSAAATVTLDNRRFSSDDSINSPLLTTRTIPLTDQNPIANFPPIYQSARIFPKPSNYVFAINDFGTHVVRFHFKPFISSNYDLGHAKFHVLIDNYVVLSNFSVIDDVGNALIKEYFIWVDSNEVKITFVPVKRGEFGFVNAIEVISAPKDLIAELGMFVNGDKVENFSGLTKQALETVYRFNVGGPKVTPFNDTMSRTWVPDDGFFKSGDVSKKVYFGSRIKYQVGGASREVGPDFVYGTARIIASTNASIPNVKMTWEFPVVEGYKYLVRLHFCDIASISLGLLNFNVYVNGYLAYENLDLSSIMYMLASPFYVDFIVDQATSPVITVSVGPSNMSMGYTVDGILNGVEIMKMNNSVGSLDGDKRARMVLNGWPRGNIGVVVPLLAVVCFLLGVSMFMHRTVGTRDPVSWSKLPIDIAEFKLKHSTENYSGKV